MRTKTGNLMFRCQRKKQEVLARKSSGGEDMEAQMAR